MLLSNVCVIWEWGSQKYDWSIYKQQHVSYDAVADKNSITQKSSPTSISEPSQLAPNNYLSSTTAVELPQDNSALTQAFSQELGESLIGKGLCWCESKFRSALSCRCSNKSWRIAFNVVQVLRASHIYRWPFCPIVHIHILHVTHGRTALANIKKTIPAERDLFWNSSQKPLYFWGSLLNQRVGLRDKMKLLTVNSPENRKPKKPRQQAGHSVMGRLVMFRHIQ